ncbi:unnamed protein product [Chrysoparadoxa australica]
MKVEKNTETAGSAKTTGTEDAKTWKKACEEKGTVLKAIESLHSVYATYEKEQALQQETLARQTKAAEEKAKHMIEDAKKEVEKRQSEADQLVQQTLAKAKKDAEAIKQGSMAKKAALEKEKAAWEEEKANVAKTQKLGGIVNLNVGGSKFQTSISTLTAVPGTMLSSMFSGRHALQEDANGAFFIDRDGTHFRHILNYLREPTTWMCQLPDGDMDLRREWRYFMLPEEPLRQAVYNKEGYNREGYDKEGYDKQGYNQAGYNQAGYNQQGYDQAGYDRQGYNRQGRYRAVVRP